MIFCYGSLSILIHSACVNSPWGQQDTIGPQACDQGLCSFLGRNERVFSHKHILMIHISGQRKHQIKFEEIVLANLLSLCSFIVLASDICWRPAARRPAVLLSVFVFSRSRASHDPPCSS